MLENHLFKRNSKYVTQSRYGEMLSLAEGYTKSHSFRVSKVIRAPLAFVYEWCTDFRESDARITGSKVKRKILLKTPRLVIYVSSYKSRGKPMVGVNIVSLHPPKRWHLDFLGDEDDETGQYRLTKLGPRKTRLDMSFTEHYKIRGAPTKAQDMKHTGDIWDKYVSALDSEYARRNKNL
jgi:hypothetical protein